MISVNVCACVCEWVYAAGKLRTKPQRDVISKLVSKWDGKRGGVAAKEYNY